MPRIFVQAPLMPASELVLQGAGARHIQVLRMQPGETVTLFNGAGGEHQAEVVRMGRSDVIVRVGEFLAREVEAPVRVHLLVGAPANERMDWLIEKATELGVASIWPVLTERSVVRLSGDRADKKAAHWQSIAQAACEQSGRNRVPTVHPMQPLRELLPTLPPSAGVAHKCVLSLREAQVPNTPPAAPQDDIWLLNGPEGGLSAAEEQFAIDQGFQPTSLGPRVLRAETAALAGLMRCLVG